MNRTPLLDRVCSQLIEHEHVHTILLFGSRANGTETSDSGYDIAAFGDRSETVRDARVIDGEFLDIFIYPEIILSSPSEDNLKLRQSLVLLQRGTEAETFLSKLESMFREPPTSLAADEIQARKTWAWKMAIRLERNDIEGNYRRVWLLTALLEDYFVIRGRRFEGPKKALSWLLEHDATAYSAFESALKPNSSGEAIRKAVYSTMGGLPDA